ncbi:MAG: SGNH/GDSL hydrolase family protein [Niabella sp.]|nr:MAG: SGNH/GDSL hydrolase family protein [Niabella sp.]
MKYLALGDSYTIGELVKYESNFPSQVVQLLHHNGIDLKLDKLIAVTGWTTDELAQAISTERPDLDFDWVSLLIGVNNQYRGRSKEEYAWQFYSLICQAILFAKGKASSVIVISIPDWGLTPFNKDGDPALVSKEIDELNQINKSIAEHFGCHYLDVTTSTRLHATDQAYLAPDLLHYSEKEYEIWAKQLATIIQENS